jgi:predicted LPLAT superfamily acyltransferase
MGRSAARLLLYPITLYFLLIATTQRRASRDYLSRVFGQKPSVWHIAKHIHCFAATILDRVFLLTDQHERFELQIHNGDLIFDQAQKGRGGILLGSHLGSFEVLRCLGAERHLPLKVLMYQDHNQTITRLLEALNPAIADTVINLSQADALLKVSESVARGEFVGMLGDRVAESDKITYCQFLGTKTAFPAGPILVAAALKVPVILFFGLYRGGNRYDIHFELLADQVTISRQQRQTDIQYWTQRYADRLEYFLRSAPYNWFNFYDYWES